MVMTDTLLEYVSFISQTADCIRSVFVDKVFKTHSQRNKVIRMSRRKELGKYRHFPQNILNLQEI